MPRSESPTEDESLSTDPANWPSVLTEKIRTHLQVPRGPTQVPSDFVFPRNNSDGRSCHYQYFSKSLVSGEKITRSWLVYSLKNNSLFCFCCTLFSKKINLTRVGLSDWKHASSLLTSHDNSAEHLNSMKMWKELVVRMRKGETIDKQELALILEAEKLRWKAVLTRLTAIVHSLAVRNLALRGHTEKLFLPSNDNFLKEVEMMAKFDPIMQEHITRVRKGTSSHTLLWPPHTKRTH